MRTIACLLVIYSLCLGADADAPWTVPDGKPAQAPPTWVLGDWLIGDQPLMVVRQADVGLPDGASIKIVRVRVDTAWCYIETQAVGGDGPVSFVFRSIDDAVFVGGVRRSAGVTVDEWKPVSRK